MKEGILVFLLLAILIISAPAHANRASVKITVPDEIKEGENFTITLEISHQNNDDGHYVEWVRLHANDVLLQEWNYDPSDFISDTLWTLSFTTSIDGETEIKAKANCNLHGGGTSTKTLNIGTQIRDDDGFGLELPLLIVILVVIIIVGIGIVLMRRR